MKKFFLKLKSYLTSERDIICVSKNGIKSKKIGSLFLMWNVLLVFWTAFTTVKYFNMRNEILEKDVKIVELERVKQKLLSNLVILNKDLSNVNNFLISLNKYDRFGSLDKEILTKLDYKNDIEINNSVKLVLNRVKNNIKITNLALSNRIKSLNSVKENLKLNNVELVSYDTINELVDNAMIDEEVSDSIVLKRTLDNNIAQLNDLEKFINAMPFSEPIQSLYVSSKYGTRLDPFLKTPREHHGVDLVGSYLAKITAPADGKIVFVGSKGGYGNVIIIEHDYGLKTVYGHLNSFNVKKGDKVKRGDLLGLQGSTGRSTGQHLHYEIIKRKGLRYNPIEFMAFGKDLY